MKRILLASALALAATGAHAQNVTLYGILDTGIEYVNHANAQGDATWRMPSNTGGLMPSRWGLRGTEDLGNGLKALFTLESGFGVDTGVSGQGGRLFGRAAWVGLSGNWGTVTLGRQSNMTFFALLDSDVMGPAVYGLGSLDNYIPNTRSDNAIGYRGTFSGLTVGATYSFGRDAAASGGPAATNCAGEVPGDRKACRQVTALLKYDLGPGGVAAAYDQLRGGTGAAGGLSSSDTSDTRTVLNGYYRFGDLKIGGGWIGRITRAATRSEANLYYLGASYALSPAWTLDGQVARLKNKTTDARSTLATVRATYSLSKRTAVYGLVGYMDNNKNANLSVSGGQALAGLPNGLNQTGVMLGMRHSF